MPVNKPSGNILYATFIPRLTNKTIFEIFDNNFKNDCASSIRRGWKFDIGTAYHYPCKYILKYTETENIFENCLSFIHLYAKYWSRIHHRSLKFLPQATSNVKPVS